MKNNKHTNIKLFDKIFGFQNRIFFLLNQTNGMRDKSWGIKNIFVSFCFLLFVFRFKKISMVMNYKIGVENENRWNKPDLIRFDRDSMWIFHINSRSGKSHKFTDDKNYHQKLMYACNLNGIGVMSARMTFVLHLVVSATVLTKVVVDHSPYEMSYNVFTFVW